MKEKTLLLRLPESLHKKLKEEARNPDKPLSSINSLIVWVLEKYFISKNKEA